MPTQPDWSIELQRRSVPARLQPVPLEKAGDVLSLEWGAGEFNARVDRAFKVRCVGDCPGHAGYITVVIETPRPGVTSQALALFEERVASQNAFLARQDERWREKYQVTGRERLETPIDDGGQRWVKFIPLDGWKLERGLWELTNRAREQQNRGYRVSGRRPSALFKHLSREQIANRKRFGSEIGSDFAEELRPYTMVPAFGQPVMEDKLRLFPQYARCPTRGCHLILRIEPCWDALE